MYHRTSRAPPETPSGTLPRENQLFQHPTNSDPDGVSYASFASDPKVHVADVASPVTPHFLQTRSSSYRPPSPSKRTSGRPNYSFSSDSDDEGWFSTTTVLMFLLSGIIVVLLFLQAGADQVPFLDNFDGDPWGDGCPDYKDYSGRRHPPFSDGPLKLPFQRPAPECRSFKSREVERVIKEITKRLVDKDLARLFENCYPSTLDTTVRWHVDGSDEDETGVEGPQSFIVTGDINAEWLRDSTNQLAGYMPLLRKDAKLRKLVLGAISTQAGYVIESPYCNAFQPPRGSHVKP